ncbi:DMT family transporter [Amycolatopsis alba]|uniref:EamA family transporter n=1 Tax=Amycolatopsis alba DSM 44262 TaxID=1125972 RepID=A0A229R7M5_AMYAL|nr:DMT family transporter [Amycolatopsis alba]OXM42489.1 EamA family transporter [Amycolatopsis alba DSM 44262]
MASAARIGLLALLWGSTFLWIKISLRGFTAIQVTFLRMVIGAAFLLAVIWLLRRRRASSGALPWRHILVSAALANAIPYLLFTLAEKEISSSSAGVINATTPMWTFLAAWAFTRGRRDHDVRQLPGLVLGFLGCVLIFSPWEKDSGMMTWGGLECLVGSLFLGVSYVYMSRFLAGRGISPLVLSAGQLSAAGALLAPALAVEGAPILELRADALVALAILGFFGTGAAYILNYRIITDDGTVRASTVTYLLPVVSIVLGATVLGERPTPTMLIGVVAVLAGVALTRLKNRDNDPGGPRSLVRVSGPS